MEIARLFALIVLKGLFAMSETSLVRPLLTQLAVPCGSPAAPVT